MKKITEEEALRRARALRAIMMTEDREESLAKARAILAGRE